MTKTEIKFKTLTPIWTGDANRKCTTIKDTSIIGSMRWWYEAIIRGMGGYACDPSNKGCQFETTEYEKALRDGKSIDEALEKGLENVCPACRLFGCTGWRRRFRIEVENISISKLHFLNRFESINCSGWIKNQESFGGDPEAFYSSEILNLKLFPENYNVERKILLLLKVIEEVGALGAKSQNGFGVIELIHRNDIEKIDLHDDILSYMQKNPDKLIQNEFRNFNTIHKFSVRITSLDKVLNLFKYYKKTTPPIITGFTLKYYLRKQIQNLDVKETNLIENFAEIESQINGKYPPEKYNKVSKIVARALFGSDLKDNKRKWASLIDVSDIFEKDGIYQYRIVCFLPKSVNYDEINIEFNGFEVIKTIQNLLQDVFGNSIEIDETWSGEKILGNLCEC